MSLTRPTAINDHLDINMVLCLPASVLLAPRVWLLDGFPISHQHKIIVWAV